jgi:hypothetical protein
MNNDAALRKEFSNYNLDEEACGTSPCAETRSAPGDLSSCPQEWNSDVNIANPLRTDGKDVFSNEGTTTSGDMSATSTPRRFWEPSTPSTANSQSASRTRRGHVRGTRNNGFASGPPFPTRPTREAPWSAMDERQKQQQIELIEKEVDAMAKESQCGIGKWRPAWMQRFATRNWMLLWLCWFCAVQGMLVNGLVPSAISTIERRFQLSTSTLGRIMQFYDFGYVLLCIPVSYFGGRHSKPLVLGLGLLLMATGSLIFNI